MVELSGSRGVETGELLDDPEGEGSLASLEF